MAGAKAKTKSFGEPSSYDRIHAVVRNIPRGRVATYGQVAAEAGLAGHARQVGYALHRCGGDVDEIPWHRVVNARGEVSMRSEREGSELLQRTALEAEGVRFDSRGRIDLREFQWDGGCGAAVKPKADTKKMKAGDRKPKKSPSASPPRVLPINLDRLVED